MDFFNGLNFPAEIYVVFQWKSNGCLTSVYDPFLSKILNFPSIRSLVGVKIAHLETKKSKNFRRLSPAYFLIVSSDFQGEAAKKWPTF